MNTYDSAKIADVLKHSHQLTLTDHAAEADVLLINTCSIREKAQEKLFHQLGRWRQYKKRNRNVIIGVGGCVAAQEGEDIFKRTPYVDIVFGPQTLHRLPAMLNTALGSDHQRAIDVSFPEIEKFDYLPKTEETAVSAFVSIMEGCSKYCSFCVVPYTRGEEVSRPFDDVISEVRHLAAQGVREVNLLGQNVNSYQGIMNDGNCADLALLIYFISKIDGIKRIRYTTSHPLDFTDSLIDVYREVPQLVSHLHLPIQSGSDRILTMMKRGHTAVEYKSIVRRLRQIRPNLAMSSDFIVGFPNETEDDFAQTMQLARAIGFDKSFSFVYSKRPGTPASFLEDNTDAAVKKRRLQLLQDELKHSEAAISQAMIGSRQQVLVEGKSVRSDTLWGRTENNRPTHFQGNESLIGSLAAVEITQANSNSLLAKLI